MEWCCVEKMSQDGNFLKYFELGDRVWLKDLKGIFILDPKIVQTTLWKTKGRTAAIGIFVVAQPLQAWRISVASLPRLLNRGTSTVATLSGFCHLLAASA